MPSGNAIGGLGRALLLGGATIYGAANSLFNVEGGHRAIVFNRLSGIKDTVSGPPCSVMHACTTDVICTPRAFSKMHR